MKKLLIISPFLPYDKIPHAGGKCHNYYLKRLNEDKNYEVKLLTFATESEMKFNDLDSYNIDYIAIKRKDDSNKKKKIKNIISMNPFDKYGGMCSSYLRKNIKSELIKLNKDGYIPDIVILEWTQTALTASLVKEIFPNIKIIAIEHDVTFQSFERKSKYGASALKKYLFRRRYINMHDIELRQLNQCNLVLTYNVKDYNILKQNNIESNVDYISPYYMDFSKLNPNLSGKNIVFFGAMNRKENYESCIWFIENVFNRLIKSDKEYKFYIVGNKPHKSLEKYRSQSVIITGFVDDVSKYFSEALCMVAPLVLGAGIKIKVLEGIGAGLIVLTNDIGIEGIPLENKKHYIHCELPEEYFNEINNLVMGKYNNQLMSQEVKKYLKDNFSLESSYKKLTNYLNTL